MIFIVFYLYILLNMSKKFCIFAKSYDKYMDKLIFHVAKVSKLFRLLVYKLRF